MLLQRSGPDSDLEEMGRTEDMRSLTSQCYRKGPEILCSRENALQHVYPLVDVYVTMENHHF